MNGDDIGSLVEKRLTEYRLRQRAVNAQQAAPDLRRREPMAVITISRQYGAGGHTVAELLCKKLGQGWTVWDRQLIDAIAEHARVRKELVEALDERRQHWLAHMVANLLGTGGMEVHTYKRHLAEVLLAVAQQGKKIIVGRGSNFVLPQALNVRLEAALEFRIRSTMEALGVTRDEATRLITQHDKERADFSRGVFDRDVEDRSAYDMVLQTDTLGFDTTAEVIVTAARCLFGKSVG